jgi:DNA-binding XRE family transcriptional regulator
MMQKTKRAKLESSGWRIGTTSEFLALTPEEAQMVEIKLALAKQVRAIRAELGLTQSQAAKRLGSSQSRVAKLEAPDGSVSLDLLVRALFALGATRKDVARAIGSRAA